jgi:hypothetical protein
MPQISKYTLAWRKLRDEKKLQLVAEPRLHHRIIKAICKKKDEDLGFKIMQGEAKRRSIIQYKIDGTLIRFELKEHVITNQLTAEDF